MNILFLIVDSLRADYCYGDKTDTPTIDRLREEGTTFTQAISGATWTPPSMASIFSGVYPHRMGMYDFDAEYPEDVTPLFSILENAGYSVGSYVFEDKYLFKNVPEANVIDNFRDFSKPLNWIEEHSDEDFFLFLHHYWVHGPYEPQGSAEEWSNANEEILNGLRSSHEEAVEDCRQKYAEAVEDMSEDWLNGILEKLENEGILDETLIVFTADHGESWGERYDDKSIIETNFHLHGKLLYDELIRVPLIVRFPDAVPEDETVGSQVRHVDLFPTVLDILDFEGTGGKEIDGESLRPAFGERSVDSRKAVSSATDVNLERIEKMSVRTPEYKLIWSIPDDQAELYDLGEDPEESCDLSEEHPEKANELKSILEKELEKAPDQKKRDSKVEERLKDLGYL